jgi:predicted nucleic acid-binding protein
MAPVLLDTSGLYEAADRRAPRHVVFRDAFRELLARPAGLLTTEVVLAETHALVLSRVGPQPACELVERLTASPRIEVVPVDAALRGAALSLLRERPGRSYSLADAISFTVMRERGMDAAFTLDADFGAAGFTILPGRT